MQQYFFHSFPRHLSLDFFATPMALNSSNRSFLFPSSIFSLYLSVLSTAAIMPDSGTHSDFRVTKWTIDLVELFHLNRTYPHIYLCTSCKINNRFSNQSTRNSITFEYCVFHHFVCWVFGCAELLFFCFGEREGERQVIIYMYTRKQK